MSQIRLFWHNYKYFPYEKELGLREVRRLLAPNILVASKRDLCIEGTQLNERSLRKLVYFQGFSSNGLITPTLQHELETTCAKTGQQKKQSTRYSVHGLHEYKGKFNPQIVRGILNILNITDNARVLDPFCGSGTTLVECSHATIRAFGFDMNPLAVFLSNAKLTALSIKSSLLHESSELLVRQFMQRIETYTHTETEDSRFEYLAKWFSEPYLSKIECLRKCIQCLPLNHQAVFFALASNLLRAYSLQEPSDLRIRRRRSPMPEIPFIEKFKQDASYFLRNLSETQKVISCLKQNKAFLCNNQRISEYWQHQHPGILFDAVVTSPPYATALPYIDTQRLSLIWLRLCDPAELKHLEADLTGSREIVGKNKSLWQKRLHENSYGIEGKPYDLCIELENALTEDDGFRRQAVPILMYRYFYNMRAMFEQVKLLVKKDAPFALVVGHNRTTLGGKEFDIDTPEYLKELAKSCGWHHVESHPLQTYQRYNIHKANAVKLETLLILRS